MICSIHQEELRKFEKDGQTWYSHKTEDSAYPKGWCNGKPVQARSSQGFTQPAPVKQVVKEYNGRPQEYWDKKSKIIALCGLANAVLSAGGTPDISKLSVLLTQIEKKAEELTLDENGPGF